VVDEVEARQSAEQAARVAANLQGALNREIRRRWVGPPLAELAAAARARATEMASAPAELDGRDLVIGGHVIAATREFDSLARELAWEVRYPPPNREARRHPDAPQGPAERPLAPDRTADPPARLLLLTGCPVGRHAPPHTSSRFNGLEVGGIAA